MDDRNSKRRINLQKIIIKNSDKHILLEHANKEDPNESCAILFGKDENVSEVFLTKNIEESPINFTISNEQLIHAYQTAEQKGTEVIGIFHSHPNSIAYPSNTDKKFMQTNPVVWIIYSGVEKNFKAYMLSSEIVEIPIEEI